jgi:hypothetical protein
VHRSETHDLANCADCGAEISRSQGRGFAFGRLDVLCFDCALRRGGSYDERSDRWTRAPSIDDLPAGED